MRVLFIIWIIICLAGGVYTMKYSIDHCGLGKTLLFGKHAFTMAAMGICD
jgi:hypothetical protein